MAAISARLRDVIPLPNVDSSLPRVPPVALFILALAVSGVALSVIGERSPMERPDQAPAESYSPIPRGEIPIVGEPIRDLTTWYAQRVSDANRAAVQNLKGEFLTPVDPLTDAATADLYRKMLIITSPLLTIGGLVLGYLVMLARTTGESAYAVRAVTPRFVVAATLSILGIYLVSVLAQFVTVTDLAMVAVSVGPDAVGESHEWPAGGGVFLVLQRGGFDPRIGEGPANWNSGAWLSGGLLAAVLMTLLQMVHAVLSATERFLVIVGPLCLAAYALPPTQWLANLWLRLLGAILTVRFTWAIVFILFSLQVPPHLSSAGVPPTVDDMNALLGLAVGAAALMVVLPPVLVNLVLLRSAGPLSET